MSTPTTPSSRPAIWAEAGTVVDPSTGLQQSGYVAGKPGRGVTNWLFNWLDNACQYILANYIKTSDAASAIANAIGTLSGMATGITASGGAAITNAQHFNMPGTTHKALILTLAVPQTIGLGATTLTLSGADAFATAALNAFAAPTLGVNPTDVFQTAHVTDATHILVTTADSNGSPVATAHVCVIITGS